MKEKRFVLIAVLMLARALTGHGQIIAWSGGGDGASWFDPNNWTGLQTPGPANNVIVASGTGTAVLVTNNVTIRSIQCTKALTITGGTFTLTAGSSLLQGVLAITSGSSFAATGAGTSFTGNGPASGDGANLSVSGGAVLSLPGLVSYRPPVVCENVGWQADGVGSVLNLRGLTNVTGNTVCGYLNVKALNGGQILLSNVATDLGGYLSVGADGSNSLVDLSSLADNAGALNLEASDGGNVLVPRLVDGNGVSFSLAAGGAISTAQLTNITGADFSVSGGVSVSLPGVLGYLPPSVCEDITWEASGPGSVLSLPALTSVTGNTVCGYLNVQALNGGRVFLGAVETDLGGYLSVRADGSNSLVDLSSLAGNAGTLNLEASDGGSVLVPKLLDGNGVNFSLAAGGAISMAQLTNISGAGFSMSGGVSVSMPGVISYQPPSVCQNVTWQASGAGSVLSLPALTNLTGNTVCGYLKVQALSGGQILLSSVAGIQNGYQSFSSDGAGSVIDLSKMSGMVLVNGLGQLSAQNGGTILLNTQAFLLANVAINIPPGNPVLPPTLIASSTLTIFGQPWHSYLVEEQNTLIPDSPYNLVARVPLTTAFEAIASAPAPNKAFRVTEFVADPPLLEEVLWAEQQTELIFYGAPGKTYQIQSTTNLPGYWAPGSIVAMTNSFRIFPPAPATAPSGFLRAKQL